MCNVMSWGEVNITVTPSVIDFGTLVLDANGEVEANATATLTWSGLIEYCSVFVDTIGKPAPGADYEFWALSVDAGDYWYGGDAWTAPTDPTVMVGFYGLDVAPGDYSIKYKFYSYNTAEDWGNEENKAYKAELTLKAKVVDTATAIDETQAKVESRKELRNGQVLIMRNGNIYDVHGRMTTTL